MASQRKVKELLRMHGWWYECPARDRTKALRRGSRDGETYAIVEPNAEGTWSAGLNLHLSESQHQHFECNSELEAVLTIEHWLEELVLGGTVA